MDKIKEILKEEITLFKSWVRRQKLPNDHPEHLDSGFVYDCTIELLEGLSRGQALEIFEELTRED